MLRSSRARLVACLALALGLAACPGQEPPPEGPVLVAEDPRYQVFASAEAAPDGGASLGLRVEMRGGWHIAEEAPVKLSLDGDGVEVAPAELRVDDAILLGEDEIEWRCALGDGADGATIAADLKLGICEGPGDQCVIVKRTFDVEVALQAR